MKICLYYESNKDTNESPEVNSQTPLFSSKSRFSIFPSWTIIATLLSLSIKPIFGAVKLSSSFLVNSDSQSQRILIPALCAPV